MYHHGEGSKHLAWLMVRVWISRPARKKKATPHRVVTSYDIVYYNVSIQINSHCIFGKCRATGALSIVWLVQGGGLYIQIGIASHIKCLDPSPWWSILLHHYFSSDLATQMGYALYVTVLFIWPPVQGLLLMSLRCCRQIANRAKGKWSVNVIW